MDDNWQLILKLHTILSKWIKNKYKKLKTNATDESKHYKVKDEILIFTSAKDSI